MVLAEAPFLLFLLNEVSMARRRHGQGRAGQGGMLSPRLPALSALLAVSWSYYQRKFAGDGECDCVGSFVAAMGSVKS